MTRNTMSYFLLDKNTQFRFFFVEFYQVFYQIFISSINFLFLKSIHALTMQLNMCTVHPTRYVFSVKKRKKTKQKLLIDRLCFEAH